jgi:UDP-galactopyranose mutase
MEYLIVGTGISGAVLARELAEKGFKVTLIDKRNHVGGNLYDYYDENTILIQKYGPHIFHTNNEEVFKYLSKYTEWFEYEHRVLAYVGSKYIPVPFNLKSLEMLFDKDKSEFIKNTLIKEYGVGKKVPILELKKHENEIIRKFADFVLSKIFIYYTQKQWGLTIEKMDQAVMDRVPVYISYEDRYFTDKFQYQPKYGFTKMIENILNHNNIKVELLKEARQLITIKNNEVYYKNKKFDGQVVFTGAIDEFLNSQFGDLPYRSLNFVLEKHNKKSYQPAAVVNYTETEEFTRVSEFKKFTEEHSDAKNTVIVKEYSLQYKNDGKMIPYYPIINEESMKKFEEYKTYIQNIKNLHLLGRLGLFKYINIDVAVEMALNLSKNI